MYYSADFRLKNLDKYKQYYGIDHPAPDVLPKAVYGLVEHNREALRSAELVACPGCYPTSILLPLIPLMKEKAISLTDISIASLSGVSGAGRKVDLPYLFAECNESARPYGAVGHRHIPEIEQELRRAAGTEDITISFVPHLIPVTRGMHSTIFTKTDLTPDEIRSILDKTYSNEAFVSVLPAGQLADTKNVVMTNKCHIAIAYDERNGQLILSSAIDNLSKGASGQAIQAMNLIFGFNETSGLI